MCRELLAAHLVSQSHFRNRRECSGESHVDEVDREVAILYPHETSAPDSRLGSLRQDLVLERGTGKSYTKYPSLGFLS